MKKLFSIFCCLLLSASMVTQAVSWSFSTNEFVNAALAGTDAGCDVRYYQWGRNGSMQNDPCTRIVVCFTSSAGVTYNGVVYPPKGDYTISTTESPWNAGRYYSNNNKWDFKYGSNNTLYYSQMYDNNGTFCKYYTGTFNFGEGDGGICVTSTNLNIAYSDFSGFIYQGASITCGTPATYYSVNVVSNNNSLGTVTSNYKSGYVYANNRSQEYKKNSVYTLTATEAAGVFVEWQKNGSRISTSNVVDVTIDGNATYTAVFEAASGGTITVNAGSNGQVKLDNGSWGSTFSNTYSGGQSATIAAQANEGYLFYQWTDNASVTNNTNPYNFTVTSTNTYTASFKRAYTITTGVNDEAFGSVGITEPYSGGKYYEGQSITLTATPANSFTSFVKWQKNGVDIAGGASLNVTVNANDTYTAFFSGRNVIDIDIPNASYTDRGSIYSLRGYSSDNKYYVDAAFNNSDDALYSLDGITYNSSSMSFTNKAVEGIDQPCGNRVITHLYCYNATGDVYCFNIHWSFPWSGDTNDGFDGGTISTNMEVSYNSTYNAIEVYGYSKVEEWNGQYTYRMVDFLFVTGQRCSDAIKLPEGVYPINCSNEPGTVMSWQSGMGSDFSLCWSQNQGVDLGNKLLDKGTVTVTKSGSTYTLVLNGKNSYDRDMSATVTFNESIISGTIPSYTLNVTTDGHGTASVKRYDCNGDLNAVSNSGSYKQGSYFRLEATPNSGYAFDYWTMTGSSEHFDENPIELEGLYDNATVTAHFKSAYALAWDANGGELEGTAGEDYTPAGYYAAGTSITAPTATRTGYIFTGWSPAFTGTMPSANTTYTAQWNAKLSSITLEDNRENSFYNTFKTTYDGATGLVVTYKRQFTKGRWSTLCLPFNVNKNLVGKLFGSHIYEFKYAEGNANEGSGVNLYFSIAKSIEAGKGYIVNAGETLSGPFIFPGVTMDLSADKGDELNSVKAYDKLTNGCSTEDSNIELVGTLRKGTLKGTTDGNTYMGLKDNKIYYPNIATGSTILAYRGIFRSKTGTLNAERIRIIVDGEEKAELEVINGELQDVQETKKFIENGVLYIERNGVIYDATGRKVE